MCPDLVYYGIQRTIEDGRQKLEVICLISSIDPFTPSLQIPFAAKSYNKISCLPGPSELHLRS